MITTLSGRTNKIARLLIIATDYTLNHGFLKLVGSIRSTYKIGGISAILKYIREYEVRMAVRAGHHHSASLYKALQANGLNQNLRKFTGAVLIFDHNRGGGANRYSQELFFDLSNSGVKVLRIFYDEFCWQIESEWDSNNIFTGNVDNLIESINIIAPTEIIINSLYCYPFSDLDLLIREICEISKTKSIPIDFKLHDFFPICPSQHLVNHLGSYCDIPSNQRDCQVCLYKNPDAYWLSSQDRDISNWRSSFKPLFDVAKIITVFDRSGLDILQRVFPVDERKVDLVPHKDDYCSTFPVLSSPGPLHIGFIGTLTGIKGASVLNDLANQFRALNMYVPITVVGNCFVDIDSSIQVLGKYKVEDLPSILLRERINFVFISSIVPETFSYTLTEAMKMRLPVVCFDIGAQGNRASDYDLGCTIPLGSDVDYIVNVLLNFHQTVRHHLRPD